MEENNLIKSEEKGYNMKKPHMVNVVYSKDGKPINHGINDKKRKLKDFQGQFTRRQLNEMKAAEIKRRNKEKGLDENGQQIKKN